MMSLNAMIVWGLMTSAVSVSRAGSSPPQANTHEAPEYAESTEGFQAQVKEIVQAQCSRDTAVADQLLERLKLPDSTAWFAQSFDLSDSAKLAERYEHLSSEQRVSTQKTIESICQTEGSTIVVSRRDVPAEQRGARGYKVSTIHPQRELSLARFGFAVHLGGRDTSSWEETFVYEKGAFRFIGLGGWPFWAWEEGAGPGVSKNGHFVRSMELIYQIPPEYPPEAKVQRVEGIVMLRAIIDKEGKVRKLEVVQGHPLLVNAAMEAVRQWRYKPATMGGNPIEAVTTVTVNFQLPKR